MRPIKISYDPEKSERNLRECGLAFERAREFDFAAAQVEIDSRCD